MGRDLDDFNKLLPLLGTNYFFPNFSPYGRSPEGWYDDDELQEHYASTITYDPLIIREVAQYPPEINNLPKIDIDILPNIDFDVVSFLSSDKRSHLVRNDGVDTPFEVALLRDKKWVMICCFFCPLYNTTSEALEPLAVSHVCCDLYASYGDSFEMVLVFKMTKDFLADESAFRHMLSGFHSSCLVVPFQDTLSRDSICHSLDFTKAAKGLFVLPTVGKVLWNQYLGFFRDFGVDAFPFTYEVVDKCDPPDYIKPVKGSLESLLLCPPSSRLYETPPVDPDSVDVTSISQIQQKLVGVYLCVKGNSIPKLHQLYQDCKANNIAFEVLVVYSAFPPQNPDPYFFVKQIDRALHKRNIRWWAFPYNSWISLRLKRLCLYPIKDELIIVGNGFVDFKGKYFISERRKTDIDEFKRRYQTFMRGDVQHNMPNMVRWPLEYADVYKGCMRRLPTMSPHFFAEETAGVDTDVKACGDTRMIIPKPPIIRTGSDLNVISFLSTHLQNSRGLVRCSTNKEIVGFDVLEGKVVMICCFFLPFGYQSPDTSLARSVALAFPDLYVFGGFELVLAVNVYGGGPKEFDEFLSWFPSSCLAVPYSDGKAICDSLKFDHLIVGDLE